MLSRTLCDRARARVLFGISIDSQEVSMIVQLILEQDGFELHWVHLCTGFFSKYTIGRLYPWILHWEVQLSADRKLFSIHSWKSADERGWLCALFSAILCMGLEHPRILVFEEILEPVSCGYRETTVVKFWGGQKLNTGQRHCTGVSASNP